MGTDLVKKILAESGIPDSMLEEIGKGSRDPSKAYFELMEDFLNYLIKNSTTPDKIILAGHYELIFPFSDKERLYKIISEFYDKKRPSRGINPEKVEEYLSDQFYNFGKTENGNLKILDVYNFSGTLINCL